MTTQVKHYIDGEFTQGTGTSQIIVTNPANNSPIAVINAATSEEVHAAIASAKAAFKTWKEVPVSERARVMLRYQHLLKEHHDELATILAHETGKTFEDAKGDVWRGIEVAEHACNVASLLMGETVENVARSIDTYSYTQPLGVCAGITPFNFPAMIPLWMFPLAIACGNTFILKPSEQDPMTPQRLVELFVEAGAPKGVLQLVHGDKTAVDILLADPAIKAISFVGSVAVGQYIYKTGTDNLKRVQAFAGAKNHCVIMPDANKQQVINNLVGASVGAAGQRCMAISVAVFVGAAKEWIPELKEALAKVRPGLWDDKEAGYGPVISPAAKARVLKLIKQGIDEGAECLLDGSDFTVEGYESGNWIGPTMFNKVSTEMSIYKEEIFGPVLCCMESDSLEAAIELVNASPYGNGTSIFTASGAAARKYQHEIEVGQVGINVPIPVPLPFFSFTGWKGSFYGDQHAYGKQAVRFYTETKTITSRWFESDIAVASTPNMSINLR
ncbi:MULTISPECIES: CoA-acylating methylmalonate-semialdehyde dehydrogenase [Shewanella]|jgi:malonate-semialdehyde dehydrogenase (acetylating)/methylmalonate-semialdehyde dehydrogenase|uniref:CoA-acylating methylmalonate-semialdehyde dehydrogenase n=1 Tax=Shewanella TaxID=22 RepID=UPI00014F8B5C|nr:MULTISPECIES: CoA-acylating methylmalonate-semialdehyde dehydrogenase [Shewanella]ABS07640.1 methylmalonate-semialdehyde dehydrogenase [Shewanella baltica OS185]MCB2381510.1 CoA-acylating methylmalonate-semialdehyde dehydrogenase [Shewanella sp. SR1]MCI2961800.1 CoA-acylating methylmalonate-semialdehyde dehydrogenase [Shewanella sp. N2AIL]MCS6094996.1 CoA-acylating methylmalonate-semialdehyde dehydrogenase [Shewanella baltica]MCS6121714.1 CoA-acylating methylmalonate-semialdehyde dehydrogen